MSSASQGIRGASIPATTRHIHEGTPPSSEEQVTTLGDEGVIYAGHQINATIYGKAVTADCTIVLYGRIKVEDVVGDWVEIKSVTVTAGTSSFTQVGLADFVDGPNQFKLQWSATGGGATSQCGLSLS